MQPHGATKPRKDGIKVIPGGSQSPQVVQGNHVDPGFWCSLFGGAITFFIVVGCTMAMFLEWWSTYEDRADGIFEKSVTLWEETTIFTAKTEDSIHEGCFSACDKTRLKRNQVSSERQSWEDICRSAKGDAKDTCLKIWVIRSSVAIAFLTGFIYSAWTLISFYASHHQHNQIRRFPPLLGIVLSVVCLLAQLVGLFAALSVGGALGDLGGVGFVLFVFGLVMSLPNIGVANIAKRVTDGTARVVPYARDNAPVDSFKTEDDAVLSLERQNTSRLQATAYAWGNLSAEQLSAKARGTPH